MVAASDDEGRTHMKPPEHQASNLRAASSSLAGRTDLKTSERSWRRRRVARYRRHKMPHRLRSWSVDRLIVDYERRRANEHYLKPRTCAEYYRHLTVLSNQWGSLPLCELSESHIQEYLGSCPRGSLPSRYSVIAAMLRWADRDGLDGIADLIPARKPARRWRTAILSAEQVRTSWGHLNEQEQRPRARKVTIDALRLAIVVPLRRGEIVSLQSHEVDIEGCRLYLHDTKSGNRVVPLPPHGRAICRRRMLNAPGRHLFPARGRQGHMLAESLSHAWCRLARACGFEGIPLHSLRHTWASHALRRGVSLEYVRRILGHTTEWMATKYAHVASSELQSAVDNVESFLIGGPR